TVQKRKFHGDEIPAVTQLFTPRWVIEFLLQNSLGRLWLEMHPHSVLRESWKWLVDPPHSRIAEPRSVASLRILDPACGTMNFGVVAIEMLRGMYREEVGRDVAGEKIAATNLFGIDIDPVALEGALHTIRMHCGNRSTSKSKGYEFERNLHCADAL